MKRLARWLMALHPREFRELYGEDLLETVRLREAERAEHSFARRWRGRAREVRALLSSAVSMRLHRAPPSSAPPRPPKPSDGLASLAGDVRYSLRGLRLEPGFAVVVIVTLSLGIGANSAIFGLLDQMLLRHLSVQDPETLVSLDARGPWSGQTMGDAMFSYPFYTEIQDHAAFGGVLARVKENATFSYGGESERIDVVIVSGNYFDLLGLSAHRGRLIALEDDRLRGAHPVAVLSHRYWMTRFGGDDSVLDEPVRINGHAFQVLGVGPQGFDGIEVGNAPDVFVPLAMKNAVTPTWDEMDQRRTRFLHLLARLPDGTDITAAETHANEIFREIRERDLAAMTRVSERFRESFRKTRLELHPAGHGISELRQLFSTPLLVLMAMVGLVLLTACANVANLLLARSAGRHRDVALRVALGASRGRIIRQLLVESSVLALAGGALGLLVASWSSRAMLGALPFEGAAATLSAQPDGRVLAFTLILSLVTGIVFGLTPALEASSPSPAATLKDGNVTSALSRGRFRRVLVVTQVALSLLLVTGAALFGRSLRNVQHVDPGFRAERLLSFSVDPSLGGYSQSQMQPFFAGLRDELLAIPGVQSASMAELATISDNRWMSTIQVEGYEPAEGENMNPDFNGVGPGYFETMGITLLAGREFTERDVEGAPKVAIVNETMARYFFGDESALGRRFGFHSAAQTFDIEIVGVVADGKYATLKEAPLRFGYVPYAQDEPLSTMTFYVRAALGELDLVSSVREAVSRLDPGLPIYDVKSMEDQVKEAMFVDRLIAALSSAFGVVACVIAAIGLYGVMSFMVTRRSREIGIRMAFGARRRSVLGLILGEVLRLALMGVVVGIVPSVLVGRLLAGQLYGVSPWDPAVFLGAGTVLVTVALVAGLLPAFRASKLDPLRALRWE